MQPLLVTLAAAALVACGVAGTRTYGIYAADHAPAVVVLVETGQSMVHNDPTGYARTLVDDIWYHAGQDGRVYVVPYGLTATLAAERVGGHVERTLPGAFAPARVTYSSLPAALGLARRLLAGLPAPSPRMVLILSDGYPYPGPHVGTPAVGRGLAALRAAGVGVHAVLFGSPGRVPRPNVSDRNRGHTAWLVMQWSGLFRPLSTAAAYGVLGPPAGSVAVAPSGELLTNGAALGDPLLEPVPLFLSRQELILLLGALYLALLAAFVVVRLRMSLVLWIFAYHEGSAPHLLVARRMIPGFSRPFQLLFAPASAEMFTAPVREGRSHPEEDVMPLVAIRRDGYGWTLTGEGTTHLYVADGPPLRRVTLRPGMEVRFGDFMLRAGGRPLPPAEPEA